jgi:hypothetical protein
MRFLAKEVMGGFGTNAATIFLAYVAMMLRPLLYIALLVSALDEEALVSLTLKERLIRPARCSLDECT